MNLADIKNQLKQIDFNALTPKRTPSKQTLSDTYVYTFENLRKFREAVKALATIEPFAFIANKVILTPLFETNSDLMTVDSETDTSIKNITDGLNSYVRNVYAFLNNEVKDEDEDENAIRIKLPPVNDFDSVAQVMNDLKWAITIPINEENTGGQVVIRSAESGSIWLLVYLGTQKALRLVAELTWSAMVILNKKKELDFVAQQVRDYELNNDFKEALFDSQKKALDKLIEGEALGVHHRIDEDGVLPELQPESQARLVLAIKTIQELIEKGAEIRPSLAVREDVKNLFPVSPIAGLIESRNKRLAEGNDAGQPNP